MTAEAWRNHLVSLDEWDAMPEDKNLELVAGVLHAVPAALPLHQRAQNRLTCWIDEQLLEDLTAFADQLDGVRSRRRRLRSCRGRGWARSN